MTGLLLAGGLAVTAGVPAAWRKPAVNKVILISIDTLRADHLSCTGYERPTSPAIDRLASQSLDFRQAFCHTPETLPFHATMFTSVYPSIHQARVADRMPLADGFTTLAEYFQANGFQTAAFVEGYQMARVWNLDQGFELYDDPVDESACPYMSPECVKEILARAKRWIDEHRDRPFFCFIHSYIVHSPYTPPEPYARMFDEGYDGSLPYYFDHEISELVNSRPRRPDEPDVRHVAALYDGEIRYMDEHIGRFLDWLTQVGLDDETILVFLSDHGEELAEHGRVGIHGHTLAEELLHVPLLIRIPGMKPGTIDRQVGLIDLTPTLLALMNIHPSGVELQGRNILAEDTASAAPVPVLSQLPTADGLLVSLRYPDRKIMLKSDGMPLLFDLQKDPGERGNCYDRAAEEHRRLVDEVVTRMNAISEHAAHLADTVQLSPELEEQLRALGYLK